MSNKLVKDYLGNLVPKVKARSILGKYYVEGESCFLMEDGQWYRKTSSDKIIYDNYTKKYVLKSSSGNMKLGVINENEETGIFSDNEFIVEISDSKLNKVKLCLNEEVATKLGYEESISDGRFYKGLTKTDRSEWFYKRNIPSTERSKSYTLESNPEKKRELQLSYEKLDLKISPNSRLLSKSLGKFTYGFEWEVNNGFIPKRIRYKYGIKALKDGSLRSDTGEGIEYVSMPMEGAKGIQLVKDFTKELSKRCVVNNYCSMHIHFGNVRRDKLYVLSLYRLITLIQDELMMYFPYSRSNSIKSDGKIYCKPLPNLAIKYSSLLSQKDEESFHQTVVEEFSKIYKWLNAGKNLAEEFSSRSFHREVLKREDGKKLFVDKWLRNVYTTKSDHHSVQGEKWNRESRYYNFNLLNLFFTKLHTVEARIHEGTLNSTKCIVWLLTVASILIYAENVQECFVADSIRLRDILSKNLSQSYTEYIMAYFESRKSIFRTSNGAFRENAIALEKKWFNDDADYSFNHLKMEIK